MTNETTMDLTINCGYNRQNEITYFAQLSYNKKRELFFRILWNKVKPSYYYDGLEGREKDITNIDHISFHSDGTVHVRYFGKGKKKDKIFHTKLQNTIQNMPQNVYGSLLILSVYDIETFNKYIGKPTSLVFDNTQNVQCNWEIENTNQFSLVFFLVGGDVNYELMLKTHYPNIFNIAASPFLMNFFGDETKVVMERGEVTKINDLGLLIGFTPKVIPRPPEKALVGPDKSKEFSRIENMLGLSLIPSDDKIRQLV